MNVYEAVQNDSARTFRTQLLEDDATPTDDLAGTIVAHVLPSRTGTAFNVTCTITDANTWTVTWAPTALQLATAGLYWVEFEVTFVDTSRLTFPSSTPDVLLIRAQNA